MTSFFDPNSAKYLELSFAIVCSNIALLAQYNLQLYKPLDCTFSNVYRRHYACTIKLIGEIIKRTAV